MLSPRNAVLAAIATLAVAAPALAQTRTVSHAHKAAWAENCGTTNWRDANFGAQGARLHASFLSGFVWVENIGWLNLGDAAPASGSAYANATGADFGVNLHPATGALSGLAWGENVGWINFSGGSIAAGAPAAASYDSATGRLRGFAWGENIGWINLDDASMYVAFKCPADFNNNGTVEVQDIFDFLNTWFTLDITADFNTSGAVEVQDIFDYLTQWFTGC